MTAYYNEVDPYAAQWLRNLIDAGLIAKGEVDERSIEDVLPIELTGYTQCHFFAGIGVWSYALRQAGWPDDRSVWTGSCPCQPFSAAGKGAGFADERHLWPAWQWLIQQCQPAVIFGEQVASGAVGSWIDLVHADLEAMGYAFGGVPFPAAGVGAPHIRDRLYWVANASSERLAQRECFGRIQCGEVGAQQGQAAVGGGASGRPEYAGGGGRQRREAAAPGHDHDWAAPERQEGHHGAGFSMPPRISENGASPTDGHWRAADWLFCRDGKWRPVEPGTFPLAHGAPARVGRLRAYGNAIVAQQAEAFIRVVSV